MNHNLSYFIEQHPNTESILFLYFHAWRQEYGDDFVMDVADSENDALERRAFYQSHGYKLIDENRFGVWDTTVGIAQCYRKIE